MSIMGLNTGGRATILGIITSYPMKDHQFDIFSLPKATEGVGPSPKFASLREALYYLF
jgi:hypothetical protein